MKLSPSDKSLIIELQEELETPIHTNDDFIKSLILIKRVIEKEKKGVKETEKLNQILIKIEKQNKKIKLLISVLISLNLVIFAIVFFKI